MPRGALQQLPYPPLSEVVQQQAVFNLGDVRGTLVGFCLPESMATSTPQVTTCTS